MIEARFKIPTASPGAMLREERLAGTALGVEADKLTGGGQLLPDPIIFGLVKAWLEKNNGSFTLDGFPRTLGQAAGLDELLEDRRTPLQAVINLEADLAILQERVRNRLVCRKCRRNVSIGLHVSRPDDACPTCGGPLTRRSDDNPDALGVRMRQYAAKTTPVATYYENRGLLHRVDATRPPADVFRHVTKILEDE